MVTGLFDAFQGPDAVPGTQVYCRWHPAHEGNQKCQAGAGPRGEISWCSRDSGKGSVGQSRNECACRADEQHPRDYLDQ